MECGRLMFNIIFITVPIHNAPQVDSVKIQGLNNFMLRFIFSDRYETLVPFS